jgi:hypothetical protein
MCGFRAINRQALQSLALQEMTYGWNIEMQMKAARQGLRILEVPLPYRRRAGGSSKVAGSLRGTLHAGSRLLQPSIGLPRRHAELVSSYFPAQKSSVGSSRSLTPR